MSNTHPFILAANANFKETNYNSASKGACSKLPGGNYVKIKLRNTNHRGKIINTLKSKIQIYDDTKFVNAPDGIYLYIITEKGLFANKVRSWYELGTLHRNLAQRTGVEKIFAAGECKKERNKIIFNLQSGTYTAHLLENNPDMKDSLVTYIKSYFDEKGLDSEFDTEDKTYVKSAALPVSEEELRNYSRNGYNVEMYNTAEQCSDMTLPMLRSQLAQMERQGEMIAKMLKTDKQNTPALQALRKKIKDLEDYKPRKLQNAGKRKTRRRRN